MAWRKPTSDDLITGLSLAEVEVYRRAAADIGDDPAPRILADTAEMVRSYCRSHGNIRLSPIAGEIPDSLISPAMDYAVVQLLKRFPVKIAEARTSARDAALRIFGDVAAGRLTPESYGAAPDAAAGKIAVEVAVSSRRRVTSAKLEGL